MRSGGSGMVEVDGATVDVRALQGRLAQQEALVRSAAQRSAELEMTLSVARAAEGRAVSRADELEGRVAELEAALAAAGAAAAGASGAPQEVFKSALAPIEAAQRQLAELHERFNTLAQGRGGTAAGGM